MITQKSEPFVVVFKRNNRCFDTVSTHPSPLGFALTFVRYSRDGVSVQHSIQEGV